jgi:hypothetical protein
MWEDAMARQSPPSTVGSSDENTAWLLGQVPNGWPLVNAICDYVHDRIIFGYAHRFLVSPLWAFAPATGRWARGHWGSERSGSTSCRRDNNGLLCGVAPDQCVKISEHGESDGASLFDRPSAVVRDAAAFDLDPGSAGLHCLVHYRCEPGEHKSIQHPALESMGDHERLVGAAWRAGEQR